MEIYGWNSLHRSIDLISSLLTIMQAVQTKFTRIHRKTSTENVFLRLKWLMIIEKLKFLFKETPAKQEKLKFLFKETPAKQKEVI